MHALRVLQVSFRSTKHDFGLLVIMVEQMVGDLMLFIELFLLVSVGFMLAFVGLTPTRSGEEEGGLAGDFTGGGLVSDVGRRLGGGEHVGVGDLLPGGHDGMGRLLKGTLRPGYDGDATDTGPSVMHSIVNMFWGE